MPIVDGVEPLDSAASPGKLSGMAERNLLALPSDSGLSTGEGLCAAIDARRSALRSAERPAFHVFEHRSVRLLYGLLSGVLFEISKAAYLTLRGIEQGNRSDVIIAELDTHGLSDHIATVLDEIDALHSLGIFKAEEATVSGRSLAREALLAHHPRKMMLMVQSNCNLKCAYCYEVQSGFHETGRGMDLEAAKQSVEFLIRRSGRRKNLEITFFGGEPLLNFTLIRQVVDYCKTREAAANKSFGYQITTNATLITDDIISFLVQQRFAVMISVDGPPEKNDLYRVDLGGRGAGAKALENARRLVAAQKQAGLRPALIRATMTHENHDTRQLYEFFASQGFERVMLGTTNGRAYQKDNWDVQGDDIIDLHQDFEALIDEYLAWLDGKGSRPPGAASLPRNIGRIAKALQQPQTTPSIGCGVGRNMQAISREGKIYPCHRYAGEDAFLLGTVETGIDYERLTKYYESVIDVHEEHCSKCWARFTCGGQCPWYVSKGDGSVAHPDKESCDGIRSGHEKQLYLIHQLSRRGRLTHLLNNHNEDEE